MKLDDFELNEYNGLKNYKNLYYNKEKFEDYYKQKKFNLENKIYFNAMTGNIIKIKNTITNIHNNFINNDKKIDKLKRYYNRFLDNLKTMKNNYIEYLKFIDKLFNEFNDYLNNINNDYIAYYNKEKYKIILDIDKIKNKYNVINEYKILEVNDIVNFKNDKLFGSIYDVYNYIESLNDILIDIKDIIYEINKCHRHIQNNILDIKQHIKKLDDNKLEKIEEIKENNNNNDNNDNNNLKRKNNNLDENEIIKKQKEDDKQIQEIKELLLQLSNMTNNIYNKTENN